jgi:hypothetical protein
VDLVVDGEYLREVRLPTFREALSDLPPAQPVTAQVAVCLRRLEKAVDGERDFQRTVGVIGNRPVEDAERTTCHRQTGSGGDGAQPVDLTGDDVVHFVWPHPS